MSDLYEAVDNHDVEKLLALVKKGVDLNGCLQSGKTVLGLAAQLGHKDCVEIIVRANQRTSATTNDYWQGNVSTNYTKCNVNEADFYERTPLHYAAEQGRHDILLLLLEAGCRVDVADCESITALHIAASKGYLEFAVTLLKAGCQINRRTSEKASALHIAASFGYVDIVKLLVNHGAKIDALDASDRTPLYLAINRSNTEVVKVLIHHGAKVNIEEIHGYTPLSDAVWKRDEEIVRLLVDAGAKVTKAHFLLHYCVRHRRDKMLQLLLTNASGFVNMRNDSGAAPLHLACSSGNVTIVDMLLQHGANSNCVNMSTGTSPLHEAVMGISDNDHHIFQAALEKLLSHRCKLDEYSFTAGDSPLFRAITQAKFRLAQLLIQYGCDVNRGHVYTCNVDNLCLARRKNNVELAKMLVYAGFNMAKTTWLEIILLPSGVGHSYPIDSLIGWLIHVKTNPLSLADQCRIVLRRSLGHNVHRKIMQMRLPTRLQQYLLLEVV